MGVDTEVLNSDSLKKLQDRVDHLLRFDIAMDEFNSSGEIEKFRLEFKAQREEGPSDQNMPSTTREFEDFIINKYRNIFGETVYKSKIDSEQTLHCFESKF
jgi:hypothetical protein